MSEGPGFAVYVHWPFCETVCPYCDFNVHAATDVDAAAWRDGLIADLAHYAAETPDRAVTSLYFGGGTPSLMPAKTVAAIIDAVGRLWRFEGNPEITIEANPTSAETARLGDFRAAGVNRLSIGIQSFDDAALAFLGRTHSGAEAGAALTRAAAVFPRVTFDLMYALPGQTLQEWERTLTDATKRAAGHLSLYQLTIESGTPFKKRGIDAADEDTAADMFELTQAVLDKAGMPAYEVSNHAQTGEESRHNLTCWRGGDYIGAGPGAHGRVSIGGMTYGTHQIHNPARWMSKMKELGHGSAKRRPLAAADRARELLMMGLRLRDGADLAAIAARSGCDQNAIVDIAAMDRLIAGNLLLKDGNRLATTLDGRMKLNAVLAALINL